MGASFNQRHMNISKNATDESRTQWTVSKSSGSLQISGLDQFPATALARLCLQPDILTAHFESLNRPVSDVSALESLSVIRAAAALALLLTQRPVFIQQAPRVIELQ